MKGALVIVLILGGFYFAAINTVMKQLTAMEDFYSHVDVYANQAVQNQSPTPIKPPPLQSLVQPLQK